MGTGDTLKRTEIPHLPCLILMDVDKWLNSLDWSALPTVTNYKNSILQSIKQAKNDDEILRIIRKVFVHGWKEHLYSTIKYLRESI